MTEEEVLLESMFKGVEDDDLMERIRRSVIDDMQAKGEATGKYPDVRRLPGADQVVKWGPLQGPAVFDRPIYRHPDGKGYGTAESFSALDERDGTETLIPRIINGKRLSQSEAWGHYLKTGEFFAKFPQGSYSLADKFAQALHEAQAAWIESRNPKLGKEPPAGGTP